MRVEPSLVFRGIGRGLIEAGITFPQPEAADRPFSAVSAAASLKRASGDVAGRWRLAFSAVSAAASLKPLADRGRRRPVRSFSAVSAAASLKRTALRERRQPDGTPFSAVSAAASLKPLELMATYNAQVAVFRGIGRGLIEASATPGSRRPGRSRVFRGIGRGLIEAARRSAGPSRAAGRRFPRYRPRPH